MYLYNQYTVRISSPFEYSGRNFFKSALNPFGLDKLLISLWLIFTYQFTINLAQNYFERIKIILGLTSWVSAAGFLLVVDNSEWSEGAGDPDVTEGDLPRSKLENQLRCLLVNSLMLGTECFPLLAAAELLEPGVPTLEAEESDSLPMAFCKEQVCQSFRHLFFGKVTLTRVGDLFVFSKILLDFF